MISQKGLWLVLFNLWMEIFCAPAPQQKGPPLTGIEPKRAVGEITKFDHVDNADGSYYFVGGKISTDVSVELIGSSESSGKLGTFRVTGDFEGKPSGDGSDISEVSEASESYETSDAQRREEHGEFKGGKAGKGVLTIQGQYSYSQPDGKLVTVQYIADDRGFRLVPLSPKVHALAKGVAQKADALAYKDALYNDPALAGGVGPRIGSAQVASLVGGGLGDNYDDESKLDDYKEDYDY